MLNKFYGLPPFHLPIFFCRRGGAGIIHFPDSGRRIAVICKISPTSNMSGPWCFTSNNKRHAPAAVLLKPQPVRRSPWQVLASFDRLAAVVKSSTRTPVRALHANYVIPHLTYFPFLQSRTLTVRPCCNLPVFCSWDMMTFHKNHARSIIFCPSSDQQNLRDKIECLCQISNWDHSKQRSVPQSPRNFACLFSLVVHY